MIHCVGFVEIFLQTPVCFLALKIKLEASYKNEKFFILFWILSIEETTHYAQT